MDIKFLSSLPEVDFYLRARQSGGNVACHYGGEEFTLILPETDLDTSVARADELRKAIGGLKVQHLGACLDQITISAGVSAFPEYGSTGETLLRSADTALYAAKHAGRNRVAAA